MPKLKRRKKAAPPPGHRPICAECGEDWPCEHQRNEYEVKAFASRLARQCHHCGEEIELRHSSVMFGGPSLDDPEIIGIKFHYAKSRRPACYRAAMAYQERLREARS